MNDYVLKTRTGYIIAPQDFILSCNTFRSMFEDTGDYSNEDPITVSNLYNDQDVNDYIKLYLELDSLQVTNEEGDTLSYLDYITEYREEYIRNYTEACKPPPYMLTLIDMVNKLGANKLNNILSLDSFFDNKKLRCGIMVMIAAYVYYVRNLESQQLMESIVDTVKNNNL